MSRATTTYRFLEVDVRPTSPPGRESRAPPGMPALRAAGWTKAERDAFLAEATSGDYDHLLRTVMKYLDVE